MFKLITHITRQFIREHPDALFVYGDNMKQTGLGGQAKECRGEPNTLGIPTKWKPNKNPDAYFSDKDYDEVMPTIMVKFNLLEIKLKQGKDVYYPKMGIGTGLAKLPILAPRIHQKIQAEAYRLWEIYGKTK